MGIFDNLTATSPAISKILKNQEALGRDYVPEKILFRKNEINELATVMLKASAGVTECLYINGGFGTGKTAVVSKVFEEFKQIPEYVKLKTAYLNCREYKTKYLIFMALNKIFGEESKYGLPEPVIIEQFKKNLLANRSVIILDEIDKLDYKIIDSLLYTLLEIKTISLILLSNSPQWMDNLSGATNSRFIGSGRKTWYRNYDLYELEAILKARAKEALHTSAYDEALLSKIAEHVSDQLDARSLIRMLALVVDIAEKEYADKLEERHILEAGRMVDKELNIERLKSINYNQRILVYSIAKLMKDNQPTASEDIRKLYTSVIEDKNSSENEKFIVLSKPSVYRLLKDLEDAALIYKEPSQYLKGVGRRPHLWKTFWSQKELEEAWEVESKK